MCVKMGGLVKMVDTRVLQSQEHEEDFQLRADVVNISSLKPKKSGFSRVGRKDDFLSLHFPALHRPT